jgi:hypothetical protein
MVMMTLAYKRRQDFSVLLVVSMLFSLWMSVAPMTAQASIWSSVKNVGKTIFVNGGALAAGFMGGVVGAAVGGGPLGMAVGAAGGFIVGKKVLNWTTNSFANFATVAGAVAGGALCIGMGFPMLAVGAVAGGLGARLIVKGISKLFGKGKSVMVSQTSIDSEAAARENAACADFLSKLNNKEAAAPTAAVEKTTQAAAAPEEPAGMDSQTAYDKYLSAYKGYMDATQKGDAQIAKDSYAEYKKYLGLYNSLVKSGK